MCLHVSLCACVCEGLACVCGLADSLCDAFWVLSLHTFRRSRSPQQSRAEWSGGGHCGSLMFANAFLVASMFAC